MTLEEEYFRQLASEKRVTRFFRGQRRLEWRQTYKRNEALDTFVYALAAVYILQPNFDRIKNKLNHIPNDDEIEDPGRKQRQNLERQRKSKARYRRNTDYANSWKG